MRGGNKPNAVNTYDYSSNKRSSTYTPDTSLLTPKFKNDLQKLGVTATTFDDMPNFDSGFIYADRKLSTLPTKSSRVVKHKQQDEYYGRPWVVILIISIWILMFNKKNKNDKLLNELNNSKKTKEKLNETEDNVITEIDDYFDMKEGSLEIEIEEKEKREKEKKKKEQLLAAAALASRLAKPEIFAPKGYRVTDTKLTNKFSIEWTIYYIDESKPNTKRSFKVSVGSKGMNVGGVGQFKFKWASPI
ncbi:MAG: hypothetical protein ISR69_14330 [Gammaproteobacteria bacterium]|nr:hypothetical protein [Gammaproteobacteria bacterium]